MNDEGLIKIKIEPQGDWPTTEAFIQRILDEFYYPNNEVRIEIETTVCQGALGFLEEESPEE